MGLFRYPNTQYEKVRYKFHFFRCLEMILCLVCMILACYLAVTTFRVYQPFKIVLTGIPIAFFLITLIDMIVITSKWPIYWNAWVLFCISGGLFFTLCTGLLIASPFITLVIIGIIGNAITAIVFFIELYLILRQLRKGNIVGPQPVEIFYKESKKPVYASAPQQPARTVTEEFRRIVNKEVPDVYAMPVVSQWPTPPEQCYCPSPPSSVVKERTFSTTTSYGGTFPVAKDAVPLPSPTVTYRRDVNKIMTPRPLCKCPDTGRGSITRSTARMLEQPITTYNYEPVGVTYITDSIYRTSEGRYYLKDGTPLIELQSSVGNRYLREPNGKTYLKDGTPLIEIEPALGERIYRGPDGRTHLRESTRLIEIHPLGSYRAQHGPDGRMYGPDGKPLVEIVTQSGETFYRGSDGLTFASNGDQVIEVEANTGNRYYKRADGQLFYKTGEPVTETMGPNIILTEVPITEKAERGTDGKLYSRDGYALVPLPGGVLYQGRDGKYYLNDGTPLILMKSTPTGELVYQAPDGTLYNNDGKKLDPDMLACLCPSSPPSPPLQCKHRKIVHELPPKCTDSRTVSVSTRLVPKNTCKPRTCPSTPEDNVQIKRNVKSAEQPITSTLANQYHQQAPSAALNEYTYGPCKCGKVHYQTVQCPYQQKQRCVSANAAIPQSCGGTTQNLRRGSSAGPPIVTKQNVNITQSRPMKYSSYDVYSGTTKPVNEFNQLKATEDVNDDRYGPSMMLQPISEVEGEIGANCPCPSDRRRTDTFIVGPERPIITQNLESYPTAVVTTDNEEAQTSETRMISANDIEKFEKMTGNADATYKY